MNILQMEDMVKGLPDDRLMQEAQGPTGEIPQFLLVSEVQRRVKMRGQQEPVPDNTVSDQIMNEAMSIGRPPEGQGMPPPNQPYPLPQGQGIAPNPQQFPPAPPANEAILPPGNGMAGGGIVRMQEGRQFPPINMYHQGGVERGRAYAEGEIPTIYNMFNQDPNMYEAAAIARARAEATGEMDTLANISSRLMHPAAKAPQPDPYPGEQSMNVWDWASSPRTSNAESLPVAESPPMSNMYTRGADARQQYYDEGKMQTLDKLAGNLLSGTDRTGKSEGNVQQWIDDNVAADKDPSRATPGGIGDFFAPMAEEGYWDRASESTFGNPIGDALFGSYDKLKGLIADDFDNAQVSGNTKAWGTGMPTRKPQGSGAEVQGITSASNKDTVPDQPSALELGIAALDPNGAKMPAGKYDTKVLYDDLVQQQKDSKLDVTDMITEARKAAWGNALMQLGAGISGGDLQAGLRNAGVATSRGLESVRDIQMQGKQSEMKSADAARSLELSGRSAEAENQRDIRDFTARETDSAFNRLATKLGLEADMKRMESWATKNKNDERSMQYTALKDVADLISEQLSPLNISEITPERKKQLEEKRDQVLTQIMALNIVNFDELKR